MGARLGEREIVFGALPSGYSPTRVGVAGAPVVTVLSEVDPGNWTGREERVFALIGHLAEGEI